MNTKTAISCFLALASVAIATVFTALLWPYNEHSPFVLYYLAIMVAAAYGNTRAGMIAVGLSCLVVDYFFIPPYAAFSLHLPGVVSVSLFGTCGTVVVLLVDRLKREKRNVHATEERLQTVVEHLSEGLVIADLSGRLVHWNQASVAMHGFTSQDEWRCHLTEFANLFELSTLDGTVLSVDDWPLTRIIRGEAVRECEVRVRRTGTGWERVFIYSGAIVRDPFGTPLAFITINDITARKQADLVATRLAALVESSDDAIIGKTLDGRITSWNAGATSLYGYSESEAVGSSIMLLVPPAGLAEEQEILRRLANGERIHHYETVRARKSGELVDVSLTVSPVRDDTGKVVAISAISRDITEQRKAEGELRASRLRYQRIVLNVPGMVYQIVRRTDDTFTFPFVSDGCREIFGVEPAEVQRDPSLVIRSIHQDDLASYQDSFAASAASLQPWKWEGRFLLHSGEVKWVQGAARPELQPGGDVLWDGLLVDITERKRAEALKGAKEEAERANVAKSEFLSRMSHELRTPLNAILGFGQVLEMNPAVSEESDSIEHILSAGRHLLKLINEVLDISRIESGRIELSPEPVSVQMLLQESLSMIRPLAARHRIVLHDPAFDSPEIADNVFVFADRQRLVQVLLNLLSNAVKYNVPGGEVRLTCLLEPVHERLRIRIADTGPGIPVEKRAWLFKPFERLGAELTSVEGTGLGLALSKRLVEAMHGSIGLEEDLPPGGQRGSTFYVELPLADDPLETIKAAVTARINAPMPSESLPPGRTLLYIEDNLSNLRLIKRLLVDHPEVRLLTAMQGGLGIDLARQHQPDLVLLDVHLPDLPGWEVLARLRADETTKHIPVVVISADATERQIERMKAIGAISYLSKPIDVHLFIRTIREILATGR